MEPPKQRHHAVIFSSAAVAVLAGLMLWLAPSRRIPPEQHLPKPRYIEDQAQQLLRQRMQRHGDDMRALVMAVVLLDFQQAERLARNITAAPGLPQDQQLGVGLPAGFFSALDELRSSATRLAEAAARNEHTAVAEAYGALSRSCVGCHALYSYERPGAGQR